MAHPEGAPRRAPLCRFRPAVGPDARWPDSTRQCAAGASGTRSNGAMPACSATAGDGARDNRRSRTDACPVETGVDPGETGEPAELCRPIRNPPDLRAQRATAPRHQMAAISVQAGAALCAATLRGQSPRLPAAAHAPDGQLQDAVSSRFGPQSATFNDARIAPCKQAVLPANGRRGICFICPARHSGFTGRNVLIIASEREAGRSRAPVPIDR
jgi:hypothetical protein